MSKADTRKRALLLVLDGAGIGPRHEVNAITPDTMPFLFSQMYEHGYATLEASGEPAGLLEGHTGNSEVGHLTIGAGRRVPSPLIEIGESFEDGRWASNPAWAEIRDAPVLHLVGLVSDAGVHGYWPNLVRTARLAREHGVAEVLVHAVLDGVDAQAGSAPRLVGELLGELETIDGVRCCSVMGRRWACDRSGDLSTTQVLVDHLKGAHELPAFELSVLDAFLEDNPSEKDFPCHRLGEHCAIADGEPVCLTNNRADRTRQVAQVFSRTNPVFALVELEGAVEPSRVFFPKKPLGAGVEFELQRHGLRSLRVAEDCKFPHVTYFFNGFNEDLGEQRCCLPSVHETEIPDHPEMSAKAVVDALVEAMEGRDQHAIVANIANLDQVGHVGRLPLAVQAAEVVDRELARLHASCQKFGWTLIITSDHGNADIMLDEQERPFGSHSVSPVPLTVLPSSQANLSLVRREGSLANVAATFLTAIGIEPPAEMAPSLISADDSAEGAGA